jgi:hypothetical protein
VGFLLRGVGLVGTGSRNRRQINREKSISDFNASLTKRVYLDRQTGPHVQVVIVALHDRKE